MCTREFIGWLYSSSSVYIYISVDVLYLHAWWHGTRFEFDSGLSTHTGGDGLLVGTEQVAVL